MEDVALWNPRGYKEGQIFRANVRVIQRALWEEGPERRRLTPETILGWHRQLFSGWGNTKRRAPAGHFRGDPAVPSLAGHDIEIGRMPGTPVDQVAASVRALTEEISLRLAALDAQISTGVGATATQEEALVALYAYAHGELIRIHPFPGGNGRTARVLVAWIAARYLVVPVVAIDTHPVEPSYNSGGTNSMRGDHKVIEEFFLTRLRAEQKQRPRQLSKA